MLTRDEIDRLNRSTDEAIQGVEMVCAECGSGIDYSKSSYHSGTSDLVLVPTPCVVCYPSLEEQGYTLGAAKEEVALDTTKKTLARLLELSRLVSTNDWDYTPDQSQEPNLRKLIDADDELSCVLFLIDKEEKRNVGKK
jgi:hypothetical protein